MSAKDHAKHAADKARGKIKEGLGKATNDEKLENEGRLDQAKADLGKAAEHVKDAFKE
ncbi:CsbD family protein [Microbacterium capsulatum]|uniref:CsbD family protein n=1 Tax=Microbacterium capsulatum TaxID=3041921 RepID=A0ABU0XKC8_9MICO|nr:CsbD family protein [Microbacterium sp. ASV81]MDQ4215581.1 CsbD family protein [Microbacterium sp. ASV81]